jgi:hypothetical protein
MDLSQDRPILELERKLYDKLHNFYPSQNIITTMRLARREARKGVIIACRMLVEYLVGKKPLLIGPCLIEKGCELDSE